MTATGSMPKARPAFDLTLYLVAGEEEIAAGGSARSLDEVVLAAVRGGVTLVQLREKAKPRAAVIASARRLKALLAPHRVPLIVNDDLEADGLHLGQDDMDPREARAALGPEKLLGLSAGNPREAGAIDPELVDYAGVGPAYATGTKADAGAAIGLAGIRGLRSRLSLPLVAIGGIRAENATAVMACGVEGVAVVAAICAAPDPKAAARELRALIDAAKRR